MDAAGGAAAAPNTGAAPVQPPQGYGYDSDNGNNNNNVNGNGNFSGNGNDNGNYANGGDAFGASAFSARPSSTYASPAPAAKTVAMMMSKAAPAEVPVVVVFDLETTGLSKDRNRIIEVGTFTPQISLNSSVLSFTANEKHVFPSVKASG